MATVEKLRRRSEFLRVQRHGKRFRGRHMVLVVAQGNQDVARIGYTVSRKVGNAVIRNKVRRRLREIARQQCLPLGLDHVVIAYKEARGADFSVLQSEFQCLINRVRK